MSNFFGGGGAGAISNETLSSHALGMPFCVANFYSPYPSSVIYQGNTFNISSFVANPDYVWFYIGSLSFDPNYIFTMSGTDTVLYCSHCSVLTNQNLDTGAHPTSTYYGESYLMYLDRPSLPEFNLRVEQTISTNTRFQSNYSGTLYLGGT